MTFDELLLKIQKLVTHQTVYWNTNEILDLLIQNTGDGKAVSLENDTQLGQTWGWAGEQIAQFGFPQIGLKVAGILYKLQLDAQETLQRRIHKGVALQVTAEIYFWSRRFSVAKRYFELALIEDTITHQKKAETPSYSSLVRDLGIPIQDLDSLIEFTLGRIATSAPFHPEEVYTDYLFFDARSKTRDIEREIFRINPVYAKNLLEKAKNGRTNTEKGDALEHLIAYVISCVDGFEVIRKKQLTKDYEIDVLFRNTITQDPILAGFGPYVLVECKNWSKKVGTEQVNHFLAKLQFHDCQCGIIVARSGISGYGDDDKEREADRRYANLTLLKAFHRNGIITMVLKLDDLEAIVNEENNIVSILLSEYERIRFDKSSR